MSVAKFRGSEAVQLVRTFSAFSKHSSSVSEHLHWLFRWKCQMWDKSICTLRFDLYSYICFYTFTHLNVLIQNVFTHSDMVIHSYNKCDPNFIPYTCRCHLSHCSYWNTSQLSSLCDWSSCHPCPNMNPLSKSLRSFPLAILIQNQNQLLLLSIVIHATEHDSMLIA